MTDFIICSLNTIYFHHMTTTQIAKTAYEKRRNSLGNLRCRNYESVRIDLIHFDSPAEERRGREPARSRYRQDPCPGEHA